jgi:outer membrane protein
MSVGVINLNRILDESKRGRTLSERLRAFAEKSQSDITALEAKLQKARQDLAKAPPQIAPESLFKLQRDVRATELELRQAHERSRFEVEAQREQARSTVLREASPLLSELANERGLTLVLTIPTEQVAFAAPAIDLTAELLGRFDKAFRG